MRKNKSAVLDIGSSKITVAIGERGENKTFLIKARKEFEYDGYTEKTFIDVESLSRAIYLAKEGAKNIKIVGWEKLQTH